eukprot:UN13461
MTLGAACSCGLACPVNLWRRPDPRRWRYTCTLGYGGTSLRPRISAREVSTSICASWTSPCRTAKWRIGQRTGAASSVPLGQG